MKKWSQIKQAALDKLFLDESEAQQQYALQKFQRLANECLDSIANSVKPKIKAFEFEIVNYDQEEPLNPNTYYLKDWIQMPSDFLSFADMVIYLDGCEYYDLIYINDKTIKGTRLGTYKIFYNALYPVISVSDIKEDKDLDIDISLLNLLPTYIAWNILAQDDPQRSMILKNEYELLLARLDNNIMYQEKHFKSEGGWY